MFSSLLVDLVCLAMLLTPCVETNESIIAKKAYLEPIIRYKDLHFKQPEDVWRLVSTLFTLKTILHVSILLAQSLRKEQRSFRARRTVHRAIRRLVFWCPELISGDMT